MSMVDVAVVDTSISNTRRREATFLNCETRTGIYLMQSPVGIF